MCGVEKSVIKTGVVRYYIVYLLALQYWQVSTVADMFCKESAFNFLCLYFTKLLCLCCLLKPTRHRHFISRS